MTDKNDNPITSIGAAIDLLIPIISNKIQGIDTTGISTDEINPKSVSAIMAKIFDDKEFMESMSKIVDNIKLDSSTFERGILLEPDLQVEQKENSTSDEPRKSEEENDTDITFVTI